MFCYDLLWFVNFPISSRFTSMALWPVRLYIHGMIGVNLARIYNKTMKNRTSTYHGDLPYCSEYLHHSSVIMSMVVAQITGVSIVCSNVYSATSKKISKLGIIGLCEGIHRWPVDSAHKGVITRKMFPFDDVILVPSNINYRTNYIEVCFAGDIKTLPFFVQASLNSWYIVGRCSGR